MQTSRSVSVQKQPPIKRSSPRRALPPSFNACITNLLLHAWSNRDISHTCEKVNARWYQRAKNWNWRGSSKTGSGSSRWAAQWPQHAARGEGRSIMRMKSGANVEESRYYNWHATPTLPDPPLFPGEPLLAVASAKTNPPKPASTLITHDRACSNKRRIRRKA